MRNMRGTKRGRSSRWARNNASKRKVGKNVTALEQDDPIIRAFKYFRLHDFDPADIIERLLAGETKFNYQGDQLEITEETRLGILGRFSSIKQPDEPGRYGQQQPPPGVVVKPPPGKFMLAGGSLPEDNTPDAEPNEESS